MKRDIGLDLIRIILTLIIVLFHFGNAFGLLTTRLYHLANGTWCWGAVGAFTIMSGYLLRSRYGSMDNVLQFYKKRVLTLFPSFYVAFVICFIIHSIELGSPFYGGNPVKIILSLLCIDSYVSLYGVSTYAVVGEWYTGMIIVLYILFPLLNRAMVRIKWTLAALLTALFLINIFFKIDPTINDASLITGIFLFFVGMLIADYSEKIKKMWYVGIILFIISVLLVVIPIPVPNAVSTNVMSITVFTSLLILFSYIKISEFKGATFLSGIAYEMYLIHQFVIGKMLMVLDASQKSVVVLAGYYVAIVAVTIFFSVIISFIAGLIIDFIEKQINKLNRDNETKWRVL